MELEPKCQCPSESHGHRAGKCDGGARKPDGLCEPCHDKTAEELARMAEQDRPLADLSERE